MRITKVDEYQFLTCLRRSLRGSRSARFKGWQEGDYLAFIVDKAVAGLAQVAGKPFRSEEIVWDNDLFPYRISLRFVHVLAKNHRIPVLGDVRDALTSAWGPKHGSGILNQQVLTDSAAETIVRAIRVHPNDLAQIESNLERFLQDAKQEREIASETRKPKAVPKGREIQPTSESFATEEEETIHVKAQDALIRLEK